MPDLKRFVEERLARTALPPEVQREVVAEIAEHLEDCHDEALAARRPDAEAQALTQVSDWSALARNIRRAKEDPMAFVRKVMLPAIAAIVVMLAAMKMWIALLIVPALCEPPPGAGPDVLVTDATCITFSAFGPAYLPWLASLLPAGALAAGLARWMGARPGQRLLAAIAPALYLAVETIVWGFIGGFFWRIPIFFVLLPAVACALGALPFLRGRNTPIGWGSVAATM